MRNGWKLLGLIAAWAVILIMLGVNYARIGFNEQRIGVLEGNTVPRNELNVELKRIGEIMALVQRDIAETKTIQIENQRLLRELAR